MSDRKVIVPTQSDDNPATTLTPCHTCGYSIPPTLNTQCPECGSTWDERCEQRLIRRQTIHHNFIPELKATLMLWFVLVTVY